MKIFRHVIKVLTVLLLTSCHYPAESADKAPEKLLVSEIKKTEEGRMYLQVDERPFIYNGIQIRIDWLMDHQKESIDDMEFYFKKASELHVNVVELPIQWKDLEPEEDAYNFRNLSKMLSFAKKYDLKVELLLFTVNIGGMTGCVPSYIKKDTDRYPQYQNTLNHPDALFFVQNNENLLMREGKMVLALMDAIYQWSVSNQSNTVISIQVRNEPDLYLRRIKEYSVSQNGEILSDEYAINETLEAIDTIAKIIKQSNYQIITRVNLCCFSDHEEVNYRYWNDLLALGSIDLVGEDTYNADLSYNKSILLDMQERLYKNYDTYAQIAENTGHYQNNASLILMANILGASYLMYDLITPQVITDEWKYYDWGILDNHTKEGKETFPVTAQLLEGVNLVQQYMVLTKAEDIAGFNLQTSLPQEKMNQIVHTTKTTYEFSTDHQSLAYAINHEDTIYLYSTDLATIKISDSKVENICRSGWVDETGVFHPEQTISLIDQTLELQGNTLYQIKTTALTNQISDTITNLGMGDTQ